MKQFLISISKKHQTISMYEQTNTILHIEDEQLLIVFDGASKNIKERYEEQGIRFIKDLKEHFSLLIYDKLNAQLYIARDKVGIKPLYYAETQEHIIVGSHLNRFQEVETFDATINPSTLGEYLQFGFILQPNTIFNNAYKVGAGELIHFNVTNDGQKSIQAYWQLESCYENKKYFQDEKELLVKTDILLNKILYHETSNSKFGFSLSGGYDSSTLAAIAQRQHEQKIDTFTIGFHDKNIDEAPHAKKIAKHLGTYHHEYYFSGKDALRIIPKMCEIFDEPFADYAAAPTIMTAELLKANQIEKLLAGDGGDEVFATAENVHGFQRIQKTPKALKLTLAKILNTIQTDKLPYLKDYNNLPIKQNKLQQLLLAKNIPEMIYSRNTLFLTKELQLLIKDYATPPTTIFDTINFTGNAEAVDEVIGSYFKTTMVDGELVKSYSAMNYHDINLSTPFLDEQLLNHMAQVPSDLKIKNGIKKYLLKEIAHQYIPRELLDRPKSGFDIPFASWMRNELKEILYSQINKERLDKDNLFYTASILKIRDLFYAGNDAYKYKLWRIFIFQLWHNNFKNSLQHIKD